jgi:hypothetical protein
MDVLSSVGAVVHEKQLNVLGVVDEESLVAGGHHVLGLLVAAVADLISLAWVGLARLVDCGLAGRTYRGHRDVALEPSTDTVVDTLGLAP